VYHISYEIILGVALFRRCPVGDQGVAGRSRMRHESSPAAGRDLENRSVKDMALDGKYV